MYIFRYENERNNGKKDIRSSSNNGLTVMWLSDSACMGTESVSTGLDKSTLLLFFSPLFSPLYVCIINMMPVEQLMDRLSYINQ